MFFNSMAEPDRPASVTISRPIHYYTEDSLHFNSSRNQLYGEIYSKECMNEYQEELSSVKAPAQHANTITTILLYTAILFLSTTSIILYAITIPLWEKNFEHTRTPMKGDWTDGFILLPLSISLISSTIMTISATRIRYTRNTLHDSRHHSSSPASSFYTILPSFSLALVLAPLLVLASTNSLARAFQTAQTAKATATDSNNTCNMANILSKPCIPILYRIGELQIGGAITAGLVCSMWIVLLVLATRRFFHIKAEEKRRREERRARRQVRRDARRAARRAKLEGNGKVAAVMAGEGHVKIPLRSYQVRPPQNQSQNSISQGPGRCQANAKYSYRSSEQIIGFHQPRKTSMPRESLQAWLARQKPSHRVREI